MKEKRNWLKKVMSVTSRLGYLSRIFKRNGDTTALQRNIVMYKWLKRINTAWKGVVTHKLRSFLTILGVVIGVASVISLMSVGRGTQALVVSSVESLGSNLMFISPGSTTSGGVRSAFGSATTLTLDDAEEISEQVPYVVAVAPINSARLQVIYGAQNMNSSITGVTPQYQEVLNLEMAEGDFISQYEYDVGTRVAVLGSTAKEELFGDEDAIGKKIRTGNISVEIIGVLESKGRSMMGSTDDSIFIPLTTLRQTVSANRTTSGAYTVSQIVVSISDTKYFDTVTNEITYLLQTTHRLSADQENDFTITTQEDLVSTITEATSGMTLLLGAIAAISLLVGGIGVMNIMLVSVIERTREIGIRKALGARERDIWTQFLIEASILTLIGGLIGVAIGWTIAVLIEYIGGTTTLVSADIIILAISVSIGIGVFFGFYPAWQASRLNPIDALRSE